ncbi:MAG: DUF4304 domain-containing protein [Rhodospirillales bacterium]|nr:DUF4304 domain-containing protein [Rhodospirillales bacterium]
MANSRLIREALSVPLEKAGFKKKSDTWYWGNDEVVLLLNLQKSQYGEQYYVNCGIGLKSLGAVDFPKENQGHIRFRLTTLADNEESRKSIELLFDMESSPLYNQARQAKITHLIEELVLPIFQSCSSEVGVIKAVGAGLFAKAMVHKLVKDMIT